MKNMWSELSHLHDTLLANNVSVKSALDSSRQRAKVVSYAVDDLVYLSTALLAPSDVPSGVPRKALPRWIGPFRVRSVDPTRSRVRLLLPPKWPPAPLPMPNTLFVDSASA